MQLPAEGNALAGNALPDFIVFIDAECTFCSNTAAWILRNDPAFNRHVTIAVTLDEAGPVTHDTLVLAISTLRRLAFGMRPFWGTGAGAIRLTLFRQGCRSFARTFVSIVRGRPNRTAVPAAGYFSHNADNIRLQLDGKLNLDGEILVAQGPVDISASTPLNFLTL